MLHTSLRCALLLLLILPAVASGLAQQSVYDSQAKERKATVEILAISTAVHLGSGNQDVYLADIAFKHDPHQLVRLVDTYRADARPIQRFLLVERHALLMKLTRTPDCDQPGAQFFLPHGSSSIFDQAARSRLNVSSADNLPCYTVRHEETRLSR